MVHKRSEAARIRQRLKTEQRLRAWRLLSTMNFHDRILDEVVHTINEESLLTVIYRFYGFVNPKVVDLVCWGVKRFERGTVRWDSRGRGTVQNPILRR